MNRHRRHLRRIRLRIQRTTVSLVIVIEPSAPVLNDPVPLPLVLKYAYAPTAEAATATTATKSANPFFVFKNRNSNLLRTSYDNGQEAGGAAEAAPPVSDSLATSWRR